MKRIVKIALAFLMVLPMVSCNKQKPEEGPEYLAVTANNLAGDWKLTAWEGGEMADADVAVYIRFIRKDSRYELYSNVGSMEFVRKTGDFVILHDDRSGYILVGSYDHTLGEEWAHRYIARLTKNRLILIAQDDDTNVCVYDRCDIPAEITDAFPPVEE